MEKKTVWNLAGGVCLCGVLCCGASWAGVLCGLAFAVCLQKADVVHWREELMDDDGAGSGA